MKLVDSLDPRYIYSKLYPGGYGAPTPPPPLTSGYGTPRPSYNGGVPQGTVVPPRPVAPVNNNLNSLTQTFPAVNTNQVVYYRAYFVRISDTICQYEIVMMTVT